MRDNITAILILFTMAFVILAPYAVPFFIFFLYGASWHISLLFAFLIGSLFISILDIVEVVSFKKLFYCYKRRKKL